MTKITPALLAAFVLVQGSPLLVEFGVLKHRLTESDVAQISRLATTGARRPWLVDTYRSQILPETWSVYAHLEPVTRARGLRRGGIVVLEAVVKGNIPQHWRVADRTLAWAQVAAGRRDVGDVVTEDSVDRPFRVIGSFTDTELVDLLHYVHTSPRASAPQPAADGGTVVTGPRLLDGRLPVLEVERRGPTSVWVWVGGTTTPSFRGDLSLSLGRWVLVSVVEGGIP